MEKFLSRADYQNLVRQYGKYAADRLVAQNGMQLLPKDVNLAPAAGGEVLGGDMAGDNTDFAVASDGNSFEKDEERPTFGVQPGLNTLSDILTGQRRSISNLYDKITENIQQRYRKPDINDLLVAIGTGMMSPPSEDGEGGFGGAFKRGLRGIGTYAQSRRAYETDMNKMLSQIEIEKAKQMADLEEKYLSSAAAALKPKQPRWVAVAPGARMVNVSELEDLPVLTNEEYEVLRRDPKNKGMKFMSTDGVPMEIQ